MAIISVLNHARTEGDQSRMVRSLGRLLGCPVLLLHRRSYAEINQLLAKGDADVAFLSSGAYMVYGKKEDVRLLAMAERNGASSYFSYVIVPCAGKAESLAELRGQSVAAEVAELSSEALQTGNLFALEELIHTGKRNNDFVAYIFLLDTDRRVMAHTFPKGMPLHLRELHGEEALAVGRRYLSPNAQQSLMDIMFRPAEETAEDPPASSLQVRRRSLTS